MTWNIEMGYRPELAASELASITELAGADIVLLQEVDDGATRLIADALGMHSVSAAPAEHPRTGRPFGNAVLARTPLTSVEELPLPYTAVVSGQPRSALRASTVVAGGLVTVYSVHTEIPLLPLARRRAQFSVVAADVSARPSQEAVVVGGDFNTVTARGVRALDAAFGAADLDRVTRHRRGTLARYGRSFELDHVFSRGLSPEASGVSSTTASDHFAVWAKLRRDVLPVS